MAALNFPKGSVSRLAFRPSIKKGDWYLGVRCDACSRPILVLQDPTRGGDMIPIVGEGKLSIPCEFCGHDVLYLISDLKQFVADEDVPSIADLRPKPTNCPRQPLTRKYPEARMTFGIGALERRPECAKVIARAITYWTYVEVDLARLLAVILKANTEPAIAMFLSLRNSRAQNQAMFAAAELTLPEHEIELFSAVMALKDSVEKTRNDLAHGIFGFSASIPDGLGWVPTIEYVKHSVRVAGLGLTQQETDLFRSAQYIYEIGDLETIARDIEYLNQLLGQFIGYLGSENMQWRATRFHQLCREPRVQSEITRLRARQKSAP